METKVCNRCKENKILSEFGNCKSNNDGLTSECKICSRNRGKLYRQNNKLKILEQQKRWRDKNPEIIYNRHKKFRLENPEKVKEFRKNWLTKNPDKIKEYRENGRLRKNQRKKERIESDDVFNLTNRLRCRIWKYLKVLKITKKNKTFDIVGCSPEFLREHLESQFVEGMTWDNKNEWHIDHIIPLSSANTEEDIYKLCHYTNLQPLWAEDNIKKSNKIL